MHLRRPPEMGLERPSRPGPHAHDGIAPAAGPQDAPSRTWRRERRPPPNSSNGGRAGRRRATPVRRGARNEPSPDRTSLTLLAVPHGEGMITACRRERTARQRACSVGMNCSLHCEWFVLPAPGSARALSWPSSPGVATTTSTPSSSSAFASSGGMASMMRQSMASADANCAKELLPSLEESTSRERLGGDGHHPPLDLGVLQVGSGRTRLDREAVGGHEGLVHLEPGRNCSARVPTVQWKRLRTMPPMRWTLAVGCSSKSWAMARSFVTTVRSCRAASSARQLESGRAGVEEDGVAVLDVLQGASRHRPLLLGRAARPSPGRPARSGPSP